MRERYITAEELLDVLCRVAERSRLLRDSVLVLDGYTGFTPVQYRLLGQLLKLCREMYVTVTATGDTDLYGPGDEADLFDMSRKMAGKLKRLAEENGVAARQDIRLADRPLKRFSLRPELDHLERTMFRYPYRPCGGPAEGIRLVLSLIHI